MSRTVVLHVAAVEFTASRLLHPQLAYLANLGYEVHLACAPEGPSFSAELLEFDPIAITFPRSLDPVAMSRAAFELRRVVRRIRPALVHFHSPAASIPGRAVLSIGRRPPRLVYTVHGFLHTWDERSVRDRAINRIERALSRSTDAVLFQSAEDHGRAAAAGYRGRLEYLGNGVPDELFEGEVARGRSGPLQVVFVGRLTREKGVGELLEATQRLPDVQWTIVGDALPSDRDSMVAEVEEASARSGGRIRWVGMVPRGHVSRYLAEADLLVLPSWREGMPRSVIEAMASGLPVIATDIRGCRELVEPGANGWLVPPGDVDALADAIRRADELPADRLARMGASGRAKAWEFHREARVFERMERVYRALGIAP